MLHVLVWFMTHAAAADVLAHTVVYAETTSVYADGTRNTVIDGSVFVDDGKGGTEALDLETLVDSQGRRYFVETERWQDDETQPVHIARRVARWTPRKVTLEERERLAEASDREPTRPIASPDGPLFVSYDAWAFLDEADDDDKLRVSVMFAEQPPMDLPKVASGLIDDDPIAYLERAEARAWAIEDRKTAMRALHQDAVDAIEALGGDVEYSGFVSNAVVARLTREALVALLERRDVTHIETELLPDFDGTHGKAIREYTQIQQYIDEGFDGEMSSGRNASFNDIWVAVIDNDIDPDHPAWEDCSPSSTCASRLKRIWRFDGTTWNTVAASSTSGTDQHGNSVAGQLIADLTDNQAGGIPTALWKNNRSGMTLESAFDFIEFTGSATMISVVDKVVEESYDIVNMSSTFKSQATLCNTDHSTNDQVDRAWLDGVFWVGTPGNPGHHTDDYALCDQVDGFGLGDNDCTVFPPGTAAGTFTANGYDFTPNDLDSAAIYVCAAQGDDVHRRNLIDVAAPGGREGTTLAAFDDTYGGPVVGTSFAAPVVAGAAANLKDWLITNYGQSHANTRGRLATYLLVGADRQLQNGTFGPREMDDMWGAGRLQMRLFEAEGMDTPWRSYAWFGHVDEDEVFEKPLREDGSGTNLDVPTDVEEFRAAMWWFEPNVGSTETPADVDFQICRDSGTGCLFAKDVAPQHRRLFKDNVAGDAWTVTITGTDIPVSTLPGYWYNEKKRGVFVTWFWEDSDRDDSDGPPNDID